MVYVSVVHRRCTLTIQSLWLVLQKYASPVIHEDSAQRTSNSPDSIPQTKSIQKGKRFPEVPKCIQTLPKEEYEKCRTIGINVQ